MQRLAIGPIAAAAMLGVFWPHASILGQTGLHEGFEGPQPSWIEAGGDAGYRLQRHQRIQGDAHTGSGSEQFTILANHGTYVHVAHDIGRPRVIPELSPSVWIKSDRPGMQLAARLVLPRTKDPQTGQSVASLLYGSSYTDVGRWQQLRIVDVPRLRDREVRSLRTQLGPGVDGREAYVDRLLLNVYGGPGTTNVWIDDLDVAGHVAAPVTAPVANGSARGTVSPRGDLSAVGPPHRRRVELAGSVLTVDGSPFFPRIIQHQGEPLALLRQLGFNAVWLSGPASPDLLEEARRAEMWLVCPPPPSVLQDSTALRGGTVAEIGDLYDRVLVWDLGQGLSRDDLASTRRSAEQVLQADHHLARPRICRPDADLRGYSWHVNLLLIGRRPVGTSLEMTDYGTWLHRQPRLARPGTPCWATVQTQPAASLRGQLAAVDPTRPPPTSLPSEQVSLLAYTAVAAGCRGLLFESQSRLDAGDAQTRRRAMALELLNLQLKLVEPWAAAGTRVAEAEVDVPEVSGTLLQGKRSRLLVATRLPPAGQFAAGRSAGQTVSFRVLGVPVDYKAYGLGPAGLRPLWPKRVAGGTRVTLDELAFCGTILLTQDPLVISTLAERAAAIGPRAAAVSRHLAVERMQSVRQATDLLARHGPVANWMTAAQKSLQACEGSLASREHRAAFLYAQEALWSLAHVERAHWEAAVSGLASPLTNPALVSFATLPWQQAWVGRITASPPGPNRLLGGDFENLQAMVHAGWQHLLHPMATVQTAADLLAGAAHWGSTGVRLTARAADPENPPAMVETPPVWITTPAVEVRAGQLVRINGWVNIPVAVTGSVDGLLILDSLSGEALAERIGQTNGWRQFTLYRAAPQSGPMTVTLALTGLGEVWLDDISVQLLGHSGDDGVARLPRPGTYQR